MCGSRQAWLIGFLPLIVVGHLAADDTKKSPRAPKDRSEISGPSLEEKARQDPNWYQRMLRDLEAFQSLSADQQERMRRLDRDLNAEDSATHKKLMRALERYVNWLDQLTPADRKSIEDAPNAKERLRRIRQVRELQWVQALPRTIREEIMRAKGAERAALIKKYRQEEKKRRQEWDAALKRGSPVAPRAGKQIEEQQNKNEKNQ